MAKRAYWLVKSEPSTYSFSRLEKERKAVWDGVRNFEARRNLREMKVGDLLLFYHSNEDKAVVGVARVIKEAYQDPTTKDDWSVVDVEPVAPLKETVHLATIKADRALAQMAIVRKSRLSVSSVTSDEFARILELGKTKLKA